MRLPLFLMMLFLDYDKNVLFYGNLISIYKKHLILQIICIIPFVGMILSTED